MRHSWAPEEFEQLRQPWAEEEDRLYRDRMERSWRRDSLENFTAEEAATLGAFLDRLIPQDEQVDLVGFMDEYILHPLGRGDRPPGMPDLLQVAKIGLRGLDELSQARHGRRFVELENELQDQIIAAVQREEPKEGAWSEIPAAYFFERLYSQALHGYFSHPRVWMRIGFMGAAYPEGYRWLGLAQVEQRRQRQVGWEVM